LVSRKEGSGFDNQIFSEVSARNAVLEKSDLSAQKGDEEKMGKSGISYQGGSSQETGRERRDQKENIGGGANPDNFLSAALEKHPLGKPWEEKSLSKRGPLLE